MKRKGKKLLSLVLALLMITIVTIISLPKSVSAADQNQLDVYPNPPAGTASYSAFTAQVRNPGGSYLDLFTHSAKMFNGDAGDPGNSNMPTGFVMFDSAGTVEMKITYNEGPLTSAKVWPQAYGITPTIEGNVITFSLTGAQNIVLEVNDNIYSALHIFANPIDTDIPLETDPNVMYFGPGVHEYGTSDKIKRQKIHAHTNHNYMAEMDFIDVPSGTTVYLAPGAIVKAQIRTNPYMNEPGWDTKPIKENITIRGRGILDLSKWSGDFTDAARAKQPEMPGIVAFYSKNVKIEGVVVVNPERQSVNVIGSSDVIIDNIKGFTSMHEGDGIVLVMENNNVTVKNSFVRSSDDALVTGARSSNILWENNVVASMRVHSIMVNTGNLTNYVARNNYVINSNAYPGIRGTIGVYSASGLTDNVLFENIEIERTRYGSMMEVYPYSIWNHVTGSMSNITFKNVNYASNPYDFGSQIGGISETEYVDGVHFENVKVDGKLVTDSASGNLSIGSHVKNVTFNGVADSGILTLPTSIVPAHSDTNIALGKTATSTANNPGENPAMAVDGTTDNGSKWEANGETNELIVDLGAPKWITKYQITHAGGIENWGTESLNTRDFQIQVSNDGSTWTTVDTVTDNTANETDRIVNASGRYVKLNITNPQTEATDRAARIYELQIYGSGYYQLYNRKQTGKSLFDNSGTVSYGDGTGYEYQWALENNDGFLRFRNRLTGNYMNIEANNGRVQTGPATGWSADWMPVGSENGYFQLRNREHGLKHIHTQKGYVESSMVGGGDWTSDQWEFVEQSNYEAEDALLAGGAVVDNDQLNYSGTGFAAGYDSIGATTTFTVNAASEGRYNLDLRYANDTGATKTISLYVNDIKIKQISLSSLANGNTWGDKVETINLNAGDNTIAYKYDSDDSGNVSLDYITVTAYNKYEAEDASLSDKAVIGNDHLNYSGNGYVTGYDSNGATTTFTVNNSSALTRSYYLDLRYANATGAAKTISLYVNGIKLRQISLRSLEDRDTWSSQVELVTLKSGLNTISYKYDDGDSGNVNLDYITLHSTTSNGVTVNPAELVAHWKFDEGSGTTIDDSSGKGNIGKLVNNPAWKSEGKFDGALAFSSGSRSEINAFSYLEQTGDETVSLWFNTSQPANGYYNIFKQENRFTALQMAGGNQARVVYWPGGASAPKTLSFPWTYNDDKWHHYVASYGQTTGLKIYVDGKVVASDATNLGPLPRVTSKILLGADVSGGEAYNGQLDDVRVFNGPLTQTEVLQLMYGDQELTLQSITAPAAITKVAIGTAKTAAALGLPATVELVTDKESIYADVIWDVNASSYNPNDETEQTFTVAGTVTLPEFVKNTNSVELITSISVTAKPTELVGHWKFDDGSGTTAVDFSGSDNSGTLIGNSSWTDVGKIDGALEFSGDSSKARVEIAPSARMNETGEETVSLWFNTSQPANNYFSIFRQDNRFTALQLTNNGTAQVAYWPNGSSSNKSVSFPWTYSDGNWHHYVASYSQNTGMKVYVDGVLVASNTTNLGPLPSKTDKIMLGSAHYGESYKGLLDDVRIYNGSLTQAQVTLLMNIGHGMTLQSITAPAAITGVVNGTAKTAADLGLLATVELVTDTGSMNADVTWDVDGADYDPTVKTVQNFMVTGTVTLPEGVKNPNNIPLTTSISVTVLSEITIPGDVAVDGVTLNKTTASLNVGATDNLVATVTPTNASNKHVTFTVDNDQVVELSNVILNADGTTSATAKALSAGTAKITVETEDGHYKEYYNVTVNDVQVPVEGVSLNKSSSTLIVGATDDLIATVNPADATDKTVTFTLEGSAVTVSSAVYDEVSGTTSVTVSAVSPGTAKIIATMAGGQTAEYEATVLAATVPATGVTLNKTSAVLNIGATDSLTAMVSPADATDKTVTYVVEGSAVTISSALYDAVSGTTSITVTAVSAGKAKIRAMTADGGHQAVYEVYVNSGSSGNPGNPGNEVVLKGINTDSKAYSLEVGQTQAIEVTAEYSDGTRTIVTDKGSYTSSNPTVITVSANGVVKVVDTGSAKVTVSYQGKTTVVEVTGYEKESGGVTSPDPETSTPIFVDIDNHAWAKLAIETLANQGIIKGTSATTFEPAKEITRADFVTLLGRALGLKAEISDNFQDVDKSDYYYEALGIVKALGIAKGTGEGMFNPEEEISRQDMMVLVARALQAVGKWEPNGSASDLNSFADASDISAYAVDAVAALVKDGIISGRGEGLISPNATTTRAEVAVIMYRLINKYSGSADPEKS